MSNIMKVGTSIGEEGCTQGCGDPHHFDADPDPLFI
jgi:hypothetical protein